MASANRQRERLTPRQREVWELLRQGLTNEEIAARMDISADGVKYHVADILRRLDVPNRYEAARWEPASDRRGFLRALLPLPFLEKLNLNAIAYAAGGAVIAATLAGVALLTWAVVSTNSGSVADVSGDDPPDALTYVQDGAIWQADGTGDPERFADIESCAPSPRLHWSPDGERLACIAGGEAAGPRFVVWDGDGSVLRVDELTIGDVSAVSWAPSNESFMLVAGDERGEAVIVVLDPDGGSVFAGARADYDLGLASNARLDSSEPWWSEEGSRLAFSALSRGVSVLSLNDGTTREVAESGRLMAWVLGDGAMLVAENYQPPPEDVTFPTYEVSLIDLATGERERRPELDDGVPFWLGPKRRIAAFVGVPEPGRIGLSLMDIESGEVTPIEGSSINFSREGIPRDNVRFSDDGSHVYWLEDSHPPARVMRANIDNASMEILQHLQHLPSDQITYHISPDARRIAYLAGDDPLRKTLYMTNIDGSGEQAVVEVDATQGFEIAWRSHSSTDPLLGIDVALAPETRTQVQVGQLPPVFEQHPDAEVLPLLQTSEGAVASTPCADSPLGLAVTTRPLGAWHAYMIRDDQRECVATWQGFPREAPDAPSYLALEGALASWAGGVQVSAPTGSFEADGIQYYPPERVTVRSTEGLFLRQERVGETDTLPVQQLVWREDSVFWRLSGISESASDPTRYNRETLLEVANSLREASFGEPPALPSGSLPGVAGCPVDDDALCQFAIDVQAALNAGDISPVTDRLAPQERPCNVTFSLVEDDIGCESPDDVSDPVVEYFNYGSDCCFKTPEQFTQALREWLDQTPDGQWRVESVMDDIFLDEDVTNLLFTHTRERSVGEDDPVITVRIQQPGDGLSVRGITKGVRATRYIPPDAEVLTWE